MPERLRFERELSDLSLRETPEFDAWRRRGNRREVDFYDRSHAHLRHLGRITVRSASNQWESRLINRGDLEEIFKANRLQAADPADFAFSAPAAPPEDRLFPASVGNQPPFNRTKIVEQADQQSLKIYVWDDAKQTKHLKNLLKRAKDKNVEQGSYIVLKVSQIERKAWLYFLRADLVASSGVNASSVHFTVNLGERGTVGNRIRTVPNDENKQVIGLIHTHYLQTQPVIQQTTTVGTKWTEGQTVQRIVHAVSPEDINSARNNEFVVYALETNQIHKALPSGRAINGLRWPLFNVLTDALETFSGRTT